MKEKDVCFVIAVEDNCDLYQCILVRIGRGTLLFVPKQRHHAPGTFLSFIIIVSRV